MYIVSYTINSYNEYRNNKKKNLKKKKKNWKIIIN